MSPNLRRVAERVLPEPVRGKAGPALGRTMDRLAVPPPGLKAGRGNRAVPGGPTVVVLLLGEACAATVADTVTALARDAATAGVRPVLVLDGPHFAPARRAGLAVDHVLSAREWSQRHPDRPYPGYLAERMGQLRRDYATDHVVTLPVQGAAGLPEGRLGEILVPPRPGRFRDGWQRLAARFEAAVDRPTSGV